MEQGLCQRTQSPRCSRRTVSCLAATQDLQNVALVELASGKTRATLQAGSTIRVICFSPDGQRIAVGAESGLYVWDTAAGQLLHQQSGMVRALTFSPDGKQLFVSKARTIEVYGAEDYSKHDVISEESFPTSDKRCMIDMLVASSDGRYLAAQKGDFLGTLHVWDLHRQRIHASFSWTRWLTDLAFSHDGKTLAATGGNWFNARSEGTTKVWDVETRRELATLRAHDGLHTALAFTPDGSTLATASDIGEITLWDLETFEERITLARGRTEIDCLAFAPGGSALLSGSTDESITIWKAASPERVAHYEKTALVRLTQEHRKFQNWDAAIAIYSQILETHENLPVRVLRGAAYAELRRWNEAAEDFAKAAGGPVDDPHDWPALATAKSDLLEKLARHEVDQHLHANNDDNEVHVGPAHIWMARAEMHREVNQDSKAEADYLAALQYDHTNVVTVECADFLISRAVESLKQDEQQRGFNILARLIECDLVRLATSFPDLKYLVDTVVTTRRWGEAIECYDRLIKLRPSSIQLRTGRALCEFKQNGIAACRARCRESYELFADRELSDSDKRALLAMVCMTSGVVEDTRRLNELASEMTAAKLDRPNFSRSTLAWALFRQGQTKEALELLSDRDDLQQVDKIHFLLAMLHHAAGDIDVAAKYLESSDAWLTQWSAEDKQSHWVAFVGSEINQQEAHERLGIPLASSE